MGDDTKTVIRNLLHYAAMLREVVDGLAQVEQVMRDGTNAGYQAEDYVGLAKVSTDNAVRAAFDQFGV